MSQVTKQQVIDALARVRGPDMKSNVIELGLVSEIVIAGENVMFSLSVDPDRARELEPMRKAAEKTVSALPGVNKVMVALTAEKKPAARPAPQRRQGEPATGGAPPRQGVPGVKHIIAVASGKGGVGKSTTAVNLALGLDTLGLEVGILDADIYGPSIPRLLALTGQPVPVAEGSNVLRPMAGYGLKCMSIGFMVDEETPVIWRGPMVMSALQQMLRDVAWGELDVLVIDMPPGTGDAQITIAQQTPLSGGVIVSTPQDLALIDARKGLNMFRKVDVPVLGIIENMSYFICPKCGHRHEIFAHGGARAEAERLGVPFLGEVPLDGEVRRRCDAGEPVVISAPESEHAGIYRQIAQRVWAEITGQGQTRTRPAPKIVME